METTVPPTEFKESYDCPPGFIGRKVVYYNLHDSRWEKSDYFYADESLPPGELWETGCVPTTLAEAVSTLHGISIYPHQVAEIIRPAHTLDGTVVDKAVDITSHFYGIELVDKLEKDEPVDATKLAHYLADGRVVVVSFNDDSPFTNTAHVIIVRAISEDLQHFMVVDNNDTADYQEGKLPNRNETVFDMADLPGWRKNGVWVLGLPTA